MVIIITLILGLDKRKRKPADINSPIWCPSKYPVFHIVGEKCTVL